MSPKTLRTFFLHPTNSSHLNHQKCFPTWRDFPPSFFYSPWGKLVLSAGSLSRSIAPNSESWFMAVLCWLGYCYEKTEKESSPFLVLTLTTASKWSDRQALVSADAPKGPSTGGKAKLSSFLLPLCFERCTSKGGNLKLPSKSGKEASGVLQWKAGRRAHSKALKLLNSC